ncbi:MAG: carbohydrate ABC transporter permease, partial [Acidimicrobiia bacterium]
MASRGWWKTMTAILLTAIMLFPVYWMVNVSLTNRESIRKSQLLPFDFTLDHYRVVLHDQLPFLTTSLVVGIGTVLLTLLIAAPAAYALAKLPVPGGRYLSFVLIVAQMIPAVVMAMGFYSIYNQIGILDTIPGLILADSTIAVPFAAMLFTAFIRGIPNELLGAA